MLSISTWDGAVSRGASLGELLPKAFTNLYIYKGSFLVAQLVKNPPAMQETWARSLGGEDPSEKGQATHSSIVGFPWWLSW